MTAAKDPLPETREGLPTVGEDDADGDSTVSGLSQPSGLDGAPGENGREESSPPPPTEIKSAVLNEQKSEIIAVNTSLSLQEMVEDKQWDQALKLLSRKNQRGIAGASDVVSIPFRGYGGDYPLHVVCDWDYAAEDDDEEGKDKRSKRGKDGKAGKTSGSNKVAPPADKMNLEAPPLELIKIILEAHPKAARTRGRDGSLPLHYAARGCAPRPILELLIKAFPQALDVRDDFDESPRDFLQPTTENIAILDRPTCCWVQHFHDEEERDHVEDNINDMLKEVARLEKEIANEVAKEKELLGKLEGYEKRIEGFSSVPHGRNIEQRAKELEDFFTSEIDDMEAELLAMGNKLEHKYDKPSAERAYVRAFDEDISLIYKDIDAAKDKLKDEVRALQTSIQSSAE